jgi:hypothetical protein
MLLGLLLGLPGTRKLLVKVWQVQMLLMIRLSRRVEDCARRIHDCGWIVDVGVDSKSRRGSET